MAELVDAHDLKSCVLGRPGSSPGGATISKIFFLKCTESIARAANKAFSTAPDKINAVKFALNFHFLYKFNNHKT